MLFKGKRKATVLRVLAAALGVLLVANGRTLAAGRSLPLIHAEIPLAANPGVDSACQSVLDASEKLYTTPFHMYATTSRRHRRERKTPEQRNDFFGRY